jgi:hypothetical protein
LENSDAASDLQVAVGLQFRRMALDNLIALMERRALNIEQRKNLGRALMAPSTGTTTIFRTFDRNIRLVVQFGLAKAARDPGSVPAGVNVDPPTVWRGVDIVSQALARLEGMTPRERVAFDWQAVIRQAAALSRLSVAPVPNIDELMVRKDAADAQENIILTALCAHGANELYNEAASTDRIRQFSGALAPRLMDPFTGEMLRIVNAGHSRYAVRSAGPDGDYDDGDARYSPDTKDGDIFLNRLR